MTQKEKEKKNKSLFSINSFGLISSPKNYTLKIFKFIKNSKFSFSNNKLVCFTHLNHHKLIKITKF